MARIPNGILGELIGSAGTVTGYMRFGQNIVRSRRSKGDVKKTADRMAQQEKIKVCGIFTKPFSGTGFFSITFPQYGHTGSGYNRATSAIMNLAITGTYPDITISYPHVLISRGPLPIAENAVAKADGAGNIQFDWLPNTGIGTAKATDKVILLAYFPGTNTITFSLDAGTRGAGQAILDTTKFKGQTAHTWTGFLSADEKDTANSVYTGEHLV